jgi:hypothetical protein
MGDYRFKKPPKPSLGDAEGSAKLSGTQPATPLATRSNTQLADRLQGEDADADAEPDTLRTLLALKARINVGAPRCRPHQKHTDMLLNRTAEPPHC